MPAVSRSGGSGSAGLVVAKKTARNHVERTYAKIGVANRIGASMYALKHGLAGPV
jgi:DNA-binding NarL/FixJ family response regulator